MALDIMHLVKEFAEKVHSDGIDLYNEASVQYELAIFLRQKIGTGYTVQLERNIDFFGLDKRNFLKKEMDIIIFSLDGSEKHCIELKYPTNGQYPEQMFSACKDVFFLEQLVSRGGFGVSFFVMFAEDPLFYTTKRAKSGIYEKFRGKKVLEGEIEKPTGTDKQTIDLKGSYSFSWEEILVNEKKLKYFLVQVDSSSTNL